MLHTQLAMLSLAAIVAVSGCGGSSKATSQTSVKFIAKADVICSRIHAEYHANGYTTPQSIARLAPRLASYEQAAVAELRRLTPPASMANDWKQIVDAAEAVASDTAKLGQYAKENKLKATTQLYTADRQRQQRALAVAARDGFKACARAS